MKKLVIVLTACLLFVFSQFAFAGDFSFEWKANTEKDLAGYVIRWGPESGEYDKSVQVGNETKYTLKNVPEGRHYAAAKAVDKSGNEGPYSKEVAFGAEVIDTVPPGPVVGFVEVTDNGGGTGPGAVIMINGLGGTPSVFNGLKSQLVDEGFNPDLLYSPTVQDNTKMCSDKHLAQLEQLVAEAAKHTKNISLVGYSRGGTAILSFMRYSENLGMISNVVAAAGANNYDCTSVYGPMPIDETPGPAEYTSVYGIPSDGIVSEAWAKLKDGANNIPYPDMKHLSFMNDERVLNDIIEALTK